MICIARRFSPPGRRRPAAVSHALWIADFSAQCVYRKNAITLPVTVTFSAQRGPVNDGGRASGRYFVAVLNAQDAVITKRVFDVDLAFKRARKRFSAMR